MSTKEQVTEREAAAWARLEALVAAVPEERRETPALEGGWSVKDVLWHIAYWWGDVVRAANEGWNDPEGVTDDVNARELNRSRALPWVEVAAAVEEARERLLAAWAGAEATDEAIEYFESETTSHYDEHGAQLEAFAADPNIKARGA